jgi:Family of unknown function (DUF5343)
MPEYLPYVNAYGAIPKLLTGIKAAAVPPKVSQNFLESVLDLTSSSHRALIPLLKKLGFIDSGNVPTQAYKDFREDDKSVSGGVMADRLREAYRPLFAANEYAWKLGKPDLLSKFRSISGAAEDDKMIPTVASTFLELSKFAKWEGGAAPKREPEPAGAGGGGGTPSKRDEMSEGIRLSYTINLNLPATTEIEVFNAIFKSLRDNLMRQ